MSWSAESQRVVSVGPLSLMFSYLKSKVHSPEVGRAGIQIILRFVRPTPWPIGGSLVHRQSSSLSTKATQPTAVREAPRKSDDDFCY